MLEGHDARLFDLSLEVPGGLVGGVDDAAVQMRGLGLGGGGGGHAGASPAVLACQAAGRSSLLIFFHSPNKSAMRT